MYILREPMASLVQYSKVRATHSSSYVQKAVDINQPTACRLAFVAHQANSYKQNLQYGLCFSTRTKIVDNATLSHKCCIASASASLTNYTINHLPRLQSMTFLVTNPVLQSNARFFLKSSTGTPFGFSSGVME
eukprot:GFKZ01009435.1.p1 GENE.GFKZ01009435.1~~GFKZ01009435.1.p1  ORF type:complete len:133 (-),score=6.56 GFKZ01009435.1:1204-1602(-)